MLSIYGAMIGDIVGSKYEFDNIKTKDFPLLSEGCGYTDDTIMTVAAARAIMDAQKDHRNGGTRGFTDLLVEHMRQLGRKYPNPIGAYGARFSGWLRSNDPQPYNSCGNGSAMRVSPCALAAVAPEDALSLARASAWVTHNHPEGIRGAEATAAAVYLAKTGASMAEIRACLEEHFYRLNFTLDEIRPTYRFEGTCQKSVPQALEAFLESESFEDAIRNVVSIGGDTDTTGAIAGAPAWVFYACRNSGQPDAEQARIRDSILPLLPQEFIDTAEQFREFCAARMSSYRRVGIVSDILSPEEVKRFRTGWQCPYDGPL